LVPSRCLAVDDASVENGENLASQGLEAEDMVAAALELLGKQGAAGSGN